MNKHDIPYSCQKLWHALKIVVQEDDPKRRDLEEFMAAKEWALALELIQSIAHEHKRTEIVEAAELLFQEMLESGDSDK